MKKYLWVYFLIGIGTVVCSFGQTKQDDIIRLLEITKVKDSAYQALEMFIPQLQQIAPNIPNEVWDMFRARLDLDDFIKGYIPIYDHFYTHEEIKKMLKFYGTPIGQKMIEVQSPMTEMSMTYGQEWGRRLGEQIVEELRRQGYLDPI
jgi:hypothetical protein